MINPAVEPLYVTSLEEVFWGGMLVAITMATHGFGMLAVLRVNQVIEHRIRTRTGPVAGIFPVILASWMIILVHLLEVAVWAAFFLWKDAFPNHSVAFYFSLNEYTTLGSSYHLPPRWQLLEGMTATAGLLTFAWSTGILLTLAQAFQQKQIQWFKQRQLPPAGTALPP